jgi:hypothetical protein
VRNVFLSGYGEVQEMKDRLAQLRGMRSIRDFGGVYLVEGRYSHNAARHEKVASLSLIDVNLTDSYRKKVQEFQRQYPSKVIELIEGDFRKASTFTDLKPVDVPLLFEVLLHQENYVSVVESVTGLTQRAVCVAQPVLREKLFPLPSSSTLLQFWPQQLKGEMRSGSFWPKESSASRFTTSSWMWGHTASPLVDVFRGFGWEPVTPTLVRNVCGVYWDFFLATFVPSRRREG